MIIRSGRQLITPGHIVAIIGPERNVYSKQRQIWQDLSGGGLTEHAAGGPPLTAEERREIAERMFGEAR